VGLQAAAAAAVLLFAYFTACKELLHAVAVADIPLHLLLFVYDLLLARRSFNESPALLHAAHAVCCCRAHR
jgi:hypothetical protein